MYVTSQTHFAAFSPKEGTFYTSGHRVQYVLYIWQQGTIRFIHLAAGYNTFYTSDNMVQRVLYICQQDTFYTSDNRVRFIHLTTGYVLYIWQQGLPTDFNKEI